MRSPGPAARGPRAASFDGIDIDWEYPVCCGLDGNTNQPADQHNVSLLFKQFRRQLDALGAKTGHRYLLTAAIPSGYEQAGVSYNLPRVAHILNFINVMTYDFHGTWEDTTNINSPFTEDPAAPSPPAAKPYWNTTGSINWFKSTGVPAWKLVVGMPFYANQYLRVPNVNHGLYQPYDNSGMDQPDSDWSTLSSLTYHDLVDVAGIVDPHPVDGIAPRGLAGYTRLWNAGAGEPYLWNSAAQRFGQMVGSFISYDDPQSIAERAQFIKAQGLRGGMFWELSNDDNAHDLLNALSSHLHRAGRAAAGRVTRGRSGSGVGIGRCARIPARRRSSSVVEQGTHKPLVGGSNPPSATNPRPDLPVPRGTHPQGLPGRIQG